jgi:hypothetical protein
MEIFGGAQYVETFEIKEDAAPPSYRYGACSSLENRRLLLLPI